MRCTKIIAANNKRVILLALSLSLFSSQIGVQLAVAKRPSFLVPSNEKLVESVEPQANPLNIVEKNPPANSNNTNLLLAPVTLDNDVSVSSTKNEAGNTAILKSTIAITNFVPKGPSDPASKSLFVAPQGIADKLSDSLKKAKQVNVMPLPLLMSEDEAEKKIETIVDSEKQELAELWESALSRSPDIQFVIQKLMPTSNPGHAATIIMRMLSTAVFGAMGAAQMLMPNPAGYAISGTTGSAVMSLLSSQEGKIAKNARLSQTEAIMLYNMVRNTADKLVEDFRNYKKNLTALQKANSDLQDLQAMVSEARAGQDASKQVEMEYTIRKQQRDVDALSDDLRRWRQSLVDLSGAESVAKLDKQIENEQNKIEQATPAGIPQVNPTNEPSSNPQTANNPAAARG